MKVIATRKSEQNNAAIDPWTVVHFGIGLGAGLMDFGFWKMMAVGAAYEIFEQALERSDFGKDLFKTSGPENIPNVAVDLSVYALGIWLGHRWNRS